MYSEDINKYLKNLSAHLKKQQTIHLHTETSLLSSSEGDSIDIKLSDTYESLDINIQIPSERSKPATIDIKDDEQKNIHANIGNSRNVSLEHDISFIAQVIEEASKKEEAVSYVKKKLVEVFKKSNKPKEDEEYKPSKKKVTKKVKISLDKDKLNDIIQRANFKGANILSWHKTPNNKIVLVFKNKDNENYGSEVETNVHLYHAYLLKNKNPSTRVF